ncbi:ATP-dependent Clp protease ATP-binding subunit ClpX-like [Ylistrum balloti]|uniref:ATP-dependent Clp protease ATP-binding subunit ClpX-like n=1 Tax=Ylistrum balloti TaxID=509963 RepID=UPI002905AFC7|nr:ATP-dependent Clp protease ATP-binding subunit ClpX-like [Ylistrum balloti]
MTSVVIQKFVTQSKGSICSGTLLEKQHFHIVISRCFGGTSSLFYSKKHSKGKPKVHRSMLDQSFEYMEHESQMYKGGTNIIKYRDVPSPKQIFRFLQERVIGQERAKRVLSSAIYYHYRRIQHNEQIKEKPILHRSISSAERASTQDFVRQNPHDNTLGSNAAKYNPHQKLLTQTAYINTVIPNHLQELLDADNANSVEKNMVLEKSNILLLGPTGSGKTLLANAVAEFLDVPFYVGDCTSLTISGYVGDDVETLLSGLLSNANNDLERCQQGIIFLDEIDKLKKTSSLNSDRDVGGEGVQQRLLKILEGTKVRVPDKRSMPSSYKEIDTTNILFVGSGAFNGLDQIIRNDRDRKVFGFGKQTEDQTDADSLIAEVEPKDIIKFGMIPEFCGRMPILVPFHGLSTDMLVKILTEPKNAVANQFIAQFKTENCQLVFTPDALHTVAESAFQKNVGARGLRSLLENLLEDPLFEVPNSNIKKVVITKEVVLGQKPPNYFKS